MRPFKIVDVFTATPFMGNPVAVVMQADGLSDAQMQAIAAWTNLSETTFHLTPETAGADYRLRIFTPRSELPFAGHPTLGSAHALVEAGLVTPRDGRLVQECATGLVPITLEGEGAERRLQLEMPEAQITPLSEVEATRLTGILGQPYAAGTAPAMVNVGPRWIVAELANAETVIALTPDLAASAAFETEMGVTGVTVFGRHAEGPAQIETRSFAPGDGIAEDPVCGSGNGSVAAFRMEIGTLAEGDSYVAAQGRCVGRAGAVAVSVSGGKVYVGGAAVTTVEGTIAL
ncbi:PhzF family phenazine biosynthesis protein [Maritimibacter alkaliphilus]|uniref:PhzF family phenazine biosynthesis protein n=1 Tax=Maritimibacter alkaliphilus TaxID=404236 RepID=UPI001C96E175|nr:PhzF family phenazine biosynthesis protein [Maritimibacter alkaliphilus]MBY6093081.1 PhzF family phenazine biosynthesis protein [Maritimibacter alkaliphilus]